jgi:hypothetical protein
MRVLFLVLAQLPVSSLGWPQFALWIDDCDPSLHQSDKKVVSEICYIRTVLLYDCKILISIISPKENLLRRDCYFDYGITLSSENRGNQYLFTKYQCSLDIDIKMACSPSFSQVLFDVSIGAASEELVFPPPASPF